MPIRPDTKNWTWVLDRRCEECGFDGPGFATAGVGSVTRAIAVAWQDVLTRPDVRDRPNDDTWSPLEYGCHVRDVYRICDDRLALMLRRDDPTFANWDQDETALDDNYGGQNPEVVARELFDAAYRFADRYDTVTGSQWARTGTRSDGSRFTVESFATYVTHDPIHHLHDVGAPLPGMG